MLLGRKATWSFLLLWTSLLSSAVCVCVNFERTLHPVASSDAMDPSEMSELQRLLKKAQDAGLVDGKLDVKKSGGKAPSVSHSSGAMTDASKRRMVEVPDDDWSSVEHVDFPTVTSTDPAVEDDLKKRNFISKEVWASIYSDLDDSVAVPEDMRDVYQWGRVRIDMDKYADLKISFEKAVAMAKSGDSDMSRYLSFIKNKYGKMTGDTQAFDLGKFLLKIKLSGKKSGYNRVLVD